MPGRRDIWKFPLGQTMQLPAGARILKVGLDASQDIVLWAEVNPQAQLVTRRFADVFTGQEAPDGGTYLGTIVGELLVHHIYELPS